jgi:hypothetical protein
MTLLHAQPTHSPEYNTQYVSHTKRYMDARKQKFRTISFRFAPLHRMCDAMTLLHAQPTHSPELPRSVGRDPQSNCGVTQESYISISDSDTDNKEFIRISKEISLATWSIQFIKEELEFEDTNGLRTPGGPTAVQINTLELVFKNSFFLWTETYRFMIMYLVRHTRRRRFEHVERFVPFF